MSNKIPESNSVLFQNSRLFLHFYNVFESSLSTGYKTEEKLLDLHFSFKNDKNFAGTLCADKKPLAFIGSAYGDEGKGKSIACFLEGNPVYDIPYYSGLKPVCVRYNGGSNAGHVVWRNGVKFVLHQLPIGILFGHHCLIGPGCVLDVPALAEEIAQVFKLANENAITLGYLHISQRAVLVREKHKSKDKEELYSSIGTTGRGIGPAFSDKVKRSAFLWGHVILSTELESILSKRLHDSLEADYVLLEGAQGFGLDLDIGHYPYVTSTPCLPNLATLGLSTARGYNTVLITKPYDTRSGKDNVLEDTYARKLSPDLVKTIREVGGEKGSTTGRDRGIYPWDSELFQHAVETLEPILVVINKIDTTLQSLDVHGDNFCGRSCRYEGIEMLDYGTFCFSDCEVILGLGPDGKEDFKVKSEDEFREALFDGVTYKLYSLYHVKRKRKMQEDAKLNLQREENEKT